MRVLLALLCVLGALSLGCGPKRPLERSTSIGEPAPPPGVAEVPVQGHTVEIQMKAGCTVHGELLATGASHLWVRRHGRREVLGVPLVFAERVDIELYESESGGVGVWTTLGVLSTPSHGGFLIISLPVWLLAGISTSAGTAGLGDTRAAPTGFPKLYQYARFPQGLPSQLRATAVDFTGCP